MNVYIFVNNFNLRTKNYIKGVLLRTMHLQKTFLSGGIPDGFIVLTFVRLFLPFHNGIIYASATFTIYLKFYQYSRILDHYNRPNRRTIESLEEKIKSTYSLHKVPVQVRQRNIRSKENIVAVRESIRDDPNLSFIRQSQALNIPNTSL